MSVHLTPANLTGFDRDSFEHHCALRLARELLTDAPSTFEDRFRHALTDRWQTMAKLLSGPAAYYHEIAFREQREKDRRLDEIRERRRAGAPA